MNEDKPLYAVDSSSGMIFEVKFLTDQTSGNEVLLRPATPIFYPYIQLISLEEFEDRFEEFLGNPDEVKAFSEYGKLVPLTAEES